jgi:hypothetical protein
MRTAVIVKTLQAIRLNPADTPHPARDFLLNCHKGLCRRLRRHRIDNRLVTEAFEFAIAQDVQREFVR